MSPDQDTLHRAGRTLRFWAAISVSVLLLAVAALVMYGTALGVTGLIGILIIIAGIEALLRSRLLAFLASLMITFLIFLGICHQHQSCHRRRTRVGCVRLVALKFG